MSVADYYVYCLLCSFRDATFKVARGNFSDEWNQKRVEFIPVEWRSGLSLDNGTYVCVYCSTA